MNIAIDIREAHGKNDGKGQYVFNMVKNLLEIDSKNKYILYTKKSIPEFEKFSNVIVKKIKGIGLLWHIKTFRQIKKDSIDVFFAPTSYLISSFLPAKIKSIVVVHDLAAILFPKMHGKKASMMERALLKSVMKKAWKVIAISEHTKKDLKKRYPKFAYKIAVIPCAASDFYKPVQKNELIEFKEKNSIPEKFFLAVGTLSPRKNYLNLIEAFKLFHDKHQEFHLIIVGKKGWQYQNIFQLINKYNLKKFVLIFKNATDNEILNFYNLTQAFVFPSLYEGFGLPPLEAMKCGCPVISSNTSSLPEVVDGAAIKINPLNPLEISKAMEIVLENPKFIEKLICKGFGQANKFSWKRSAEKLLKLL